MTLHIREATDEERGKIERLTRARSAPVRLVARARIVQLALQGMTVPAIAQELGVSEKMVRLWLTRFEQEGLAGLDDAARCWTMRHALADRVPTRRSPTAG